MIQFPSWMRSESFQFYLLRVFGGGCWPLYLHLRSLVQAAKRNMCVRNSWYQTGCLWIMSFKTVLISSCLHFMCVRQLIKPVLMAFLRPEPFSSLLNFSFCTQRVAHPAREQVLSSTRKRVLLGWEMLRMSKVEVICISALGLCFGMVTVCDFPSRKRQLKLLVALALALAGTGLRESLIIE